MSALVPKPSRRALTTADAYFTMPVEGATSYLYIAGGVSGAGHCGFGAAGDQVTSLSKDRKEAQIDLCLRRPSHKSARALSFSLRFDSPPASLFQIDRWSDLTPGSEGKI